MPIYPADIHNRSVASYLADLAPVLGEIFLPDVLLAFEITGLYANESMYVRMVFVSFEIVCYLYSTVPPNPRLHIAPPLHKVLVAAHDLIESCRQLVRLDVLNGESNENIF